MRTKLVLILIAAAAVALLLVPKRDKAVGPRVAEPEPRRAYAPPRRAPPTRATTEPSRIIIDDILVEKSSVCLGEETLVTVLAHATDPAETPHLRVSINGTAGDRVPLRIYQPDDPDEPVDLIRPVVVRGRDGAVAETILAPIQVRRCTRPELLARHEIDRLTDGVVTFHATVAAREALPIVSYSWRFDDGTTVETSEPRVTHDYGARPQTTAVSSFLVECVATLDDGVTLRGRTAVVLENPLFAGQIAATPDAVARTVRLRHEREAPLRVTKATRREIRINQAPRSTTVPFPVDVLPRGFTTIPLDDAFPEDDDLLAVEYTITTDGPSARFLLRRPDLPSSIAVTVEDASFRDRVIRARELLDVEHVSLAQLFDLERKGGLP